MTALRRGPSAEVLLKYEGVSAMEDREGTRGVTEKDGDSR